MTTLSWGATGTIDTIDCVRRIRQYPLGIYAICLVTDLYY